MFRSHVRLLEQIVVYLHIFHFAAFRGLPFFQFEMCVFILNIMLYFCHSYIIWSRLGGI